jgi:hypothetical protein
VVATETGVVVQLWMDWPAAAPMEAAGWTLRPNDANARGREEEDDQANDFERPGQTLLGVSPRAVQRIELDPSPEAASPVQIPKRGSTGCHPSASDRPVRSGPRPR